MGETATDKARRIVGRVVVDVLQDSGLSLVHTSELCFLQLASKCADPELERALNEILERVGDNES